MGNGRVAYRTCPLAYPVQPVLFHITALGRESVYLVCEHGGIRGGISAGDSGPVFDIHNSIGNQTTGIYIHVRKYQLVLRIFDGSGACRHIHIFIFGKRRN